MLKRVFSPILKVLFLFLLLISKGHAFWPWSSDDVIKKHEEYFHQPCQQFNSPDQRVNTFELNDCDIQQQNGAYHQALRPLIELDQKLTRKSQEDSLLLELAEFVERKIETNLQSLEFVRECLRDSLRNRTLHQDCHATLDRVRQSSIQGLPLMREHMALMAHPTRLRPNEKRALGVGYQFKYYSENLKHPYSSLRVPNIDQIEKLNIEQYVNTIVERSTENWYQEKFGNTRCLKRRESGEFYFEGSSCERMMGNQLARHIDLQFKQARENHAREYRSLIQLAPHLAYIDQRSLDEQADIDQHLLAAFDKMHEEIKSDRAKIKLDSDSARAGLLRYPSLVNQFFNEKNPLEERQCSVAQTLHNKYGPGGWHDLVWDIGVGLAAIAGGVTCAFTAGIGCAVGVAILSEGYFLGSSSLRLQESEILLQSQVVNHEEVDEARSQRNMAILFAPLSFTGFHGAQAVNRTPITGMALSQSRVLRRDLEILKTEYVHFQPTSTQQNRLWIESARSGQGKLYFDMENAAIKRLNDTLGDKNFVTAATNLQKKIFLDKFELLKQKYPNLDFHIYSDFKSLRMSFHGDIPPQLRSELNLTLEQANEEFARQMRSINGINLKGENPAHWFNAGFGESADQAGLASRFARTAQREGVTSQSVVNYQTIRSQVSQNLQQVETQRQTLFQSLSRTDQTKIFEAGENSVFKLEVFDLLRKHSNSSPDQLIEIFKRNFDVDLTIEQTRNFQSYARNLDQFSPGLWQEQRVVANLDSAHHGGLSVDFKGLGAKNMQQLARDLSTNSNDLNNAIAASRRGESTVTELLNQEKTNYQRLVNTNLERHGVRSTNNCSGDDCVSILDKAISLQGKREIVSSFANTPRPSDYRLSFIPPGVRAEHRTHLAVHGELIEKSLRKKSTGFGDNLISPELLEKVNFAVVMPPTIGQGPVRVLVGVAPDVRMTSAQQRILQDKFNEALRGINQELSEGAVLPVRYRSDAIELVIP